MTMLQKTNNKTAVIEPACGRRRAARRSVFATNAGLAVLIASLFLVQPIVLCRAQDVPSNATPSPVTLGPVVSGTVSAPDGSVASFANVFLRVSPTGSITLPTHPLETTTDVEGRFRFEDVEPGPYRIWAETDQFTSLTKKLGGLSVSVQKEPAGVDDALSLKLHAGCGYDVAIVSAQSGQPVEDARVSFGWTDIEREYRAGDDGIARIRNLGTDDWYFIIRADGYATQFKKTSQQELGSVLPLRFEMHPSGKLVGTLRDDAGDPVPGATVSIRPGDMSMSPGYGKTQTDADGNFSFDGLPIGRPLQMSGVKEGYEYGRHSCAVPDSETPMRADFVCKKQLYGGDVVVSVTAIDGSPIPDAILLNRGSSSSQTRQATTDAQGKGTLQNLYSGYDGCNVTVKADGFIPQRLPVVPGTVEQPAEIKVTMKLGKTVRGVVVRPDGTPGEKLRVYYNGGERVNDLGDVVTTDHLGRFELRGLPENSTVTVYTPREFAPIRDLGVPVDSEEEFRIEMTAAGILRVRAVDAETMKPIPEFNVKLGFCEIRKPQDPRIGGISSSLFNPGVNVQGTKKEFRLEGQLVGAPYKLIVSAEGYEPTTIARVETQPTNTAEVLNVALEPMRAENYQVVTGRLVDADDQPIVGAQVRLLLGSDEPHKIDPFTQRRREDGWQFYHWDLLSRDDIENRDKCVQLLKTVSDSDGAFTFTGVKKGPPWMELFYFGENLMSQRYSNLRSRQPQDLEQLTLKAERPSTLAVKVDFRKYPAAHGVSLEAENYTQGPNAVRLAYGSRSETLAVDGTEVVFQHLPAGNYVVRISEKPVPIGNTGGYRVNGIASKSVVISEGSALTVDFD